MTPFTVMFLLSACAVLAVFSPRGEALRLRLVDALDAHLLRKQAAITMRLSEQRTSEALAGRSPLCIYRVAELSDPVWDAFAESWVESRGGIVVRDARIARLLNDVEIVMARAEMRTGTTHSVTLPLSGEKVSA
jgi:hypothetical protein